MARCKLTRMNLRNIRKSREYQTLLIDLVALNVVGKSTAEGLLGYTIPAGLLSAGTVTSDNEETGGEGSGSGSEQGSGGESGSGNTVTLLYLNGDSGSWETAEYTLTNSSSEADILDFAKTEFGNGALNSILYVEANPDYVEGVDDINSKYIALNPQPETIEPGMFATVYYYDENGMVSKE